MRMIDADAMKADLLTVDPQYETMIHWCLTVLDAQPTIEERKRGEWIPLGVRYGWICSKCRKENVYAFSSDDNGEYVLQDYFCPNCGADMRGEQDE